MVFKKINILSVLDKIVRNPKSVVPITLDMAKELAMVERNEHGRAARRYFIECEKKLLAQQTQTPKALPRKTKRIIRSRDDLSFTRRDSMGRLINWQPPADESGLINWYEACAIGEAWFMEIVELAQNNEEEAWYALKIVPAQMLCYAATRRACYRQKLAELSAA